MWRKMTKENFSLGFLKEAQVLFRKKIVMVSNYSYLYGEQACSIVYTHLGMIHNIISFPVKGPHLFNVLFLSVELSLTRSSEDNLKKLRIQRRMSKSLKTTPSECLLEVFFFFAYLSISEEKVWDYCHDTSEGIMKTTVWKWQGNTFELIRKNFL